MKYFVYILKCKGNKLYTGISNDPEKRFLMHKAGNGAKFTKAFKPIKLIYKKRFNSYKKASQTEYKIKQLSKQEKIFLIKDYKSKQ